MKLEFIKRIPELEQDVTKEEQLNRYMEVKENVRFLSKEVVETELTSITEYDRISEINSFQTQMYKNHNKNPNIYIKDIPRKKKFRDNG